MATSMVNATWQMYDKQQSPMLNEYSNNLLYTSTTAEILGLHFNCMPDLPTQALFYEGC
jgi:hypothetical protein